MDTFIMPQKELNYIDTLYLSCNLQDFIDDDNQHDTLKYHNMFNYICDTLLVNSRFIGTSDGRYWYELDNYRLGIMEYDLSKRANQPNCVIQYEHHHIFPLNQNLDGLELPFGDDRTKYMIKRIDITKTIKSDIDYTINHGYISPFRSHPLRPNRKETTVYLGSRKNGNVFRMYPKTIELLETKNYKKIALYSSYFGDIENLYTFEHELHRSYLYNSLGINKLSELDRVWVASASIVGKIRIFEDNEVNKKLLKQNNNKRIKAMRLTEYKEFDRPEKKKYKRSYTAMVKRVKKEISAYLDSGESKDDLNFWLGLISDLTADVAIGKDLIIDILDSDRVMELKDMHNKHKLIRDNQTDELEKEAIRAFGVSKR